MYVTAKPGVTSKQTAVVGSTKHNVVMSGRTHPKHGTAPVSLYNRHTIIFRYVSNQKKCGQKNNSHTRSRCLDKGVCAQGGRGVRERPPKKGGVYGVRACA